MKAVLGLALGIGISGWGIACSQPCKGGDYCVSYGDYCSEVESVVACTQAQVCGIAAQDVSCDQIRPWPQYGVATPCPGPLTAAIDAGLVTFSSAAAGAAIHRLQTECPATLDLQSIFEGTLSAGTACNGLECSAAAFCDESSPSNGQCGTCQPVSGPGTAVTAPSACGTDTVVWSPDAGFLCENFVADGGSCASFAGVCGPGLSCQSRTTPPACLPWLILGAPCRSDAECGMNLCRGSPSRCVAWARRGEACASTLDAILPLCQLGYACIPSPLGGNVCGDRVPLGGSCATDAKGCASNLRCDGTQTCVELGALGDPCNAGSDCQAGSVCNSGNVCDKAHPDGEACVTSQDCAPGLYCDKLVCHWAPCIP